MAVELTLALRLGLGALMALALFVVGRYLPAEESIDPSIYGSLHMPASLLGQFFLGVWPRWDAVHYLNLAMRGYFDLSIGDTVFYPLYPGLTNLVAQTIGHNYIVAGLLVATLSTVVTLASLQVIGDRLFGQDAGKWASLALATYPMSVFLIAPFTESLFLALTLTAFWAAYSRKWWIAAILAALASLTRGPGMAAVVSFALLGWAQWSASTVRPSVRSLPAIAAAIAAPVAGGLGFLLWRSWVGFPPIANVLKEYVGTTVVNPVAGLATAVLQWVHVLDLPTTLDILSAIAFSGITVWMFLRPRWRKPELIAYMVISLLVLFSRRTEGAASLKSLSRYVLVLFPAFLVVGDYLSTAPRNVRFAYIVASSLALMMMSVLYALWFFIG